MARESKRKREEKRFGRPKTLADTLAQCRWRDLVPRALDDSLSGGVDLSRDAIKNVASEATVVCADNVVEYVESCPKEEWNLREDLPNPLPPFRYVIVEYSAPHEFRFKYDRFGCFFITFTKKESEDYGGLHLQRHMLPGADTPWSHYISVLLIGRLAAFPDLIEGPIVGMSYFFDVSSSSMLAPVYFVPGFPNDDASFECVLNLFRPLMIAPLFAISLMHCKNVSLERVDPDPVANKERKKAGRAPFRRYHIINIEPMKRVILAEGRPESNGLRRALHICRGHFARYSEEKPLFGKHAGTFWIPAHARGSIDGGIITSDYRVKGPSGQLAGDESWTT